MATCNLCPPGSREVPDEGMSEHLHTVHPEVAEDGTRESDRSRIVPSTSPEPGPVDRPEWRDG
jgi:hypothetical protein